MSAALRQSPDRQSTDTRRATLTLRLPSWFSTWARGYAGRCFERGVQPEPAFAGAIATASLEVTGAKPNYCKAAPLACQYPGCACGIKFPASAQASADRPGDASAALPGLNRNSRSSA